MGSPADRERLVGVAAALTRRTPTGSKLTRELATVRSRGWAASAGEREDGVASVSVPVLGSEGEPLAVVSVSGPITRVGGAAAAPQLDAVRAAAHEIQAAARV